MFVRSFKASTLKFFGIIFLCVAAVTALVILVPDKSPFASQASVKYGKVKDSDDRVAFLAEFGWQVDPEAVDECEVTIPSEFDAVYEKYNELQKKQGFDLYAYRKKTVTRYTYKVTNYPDHKGVVLANIIVYKNKVIGGDICSADISGFIHGFDKNAAE